MTNNDQPSTTEGVTVPFVGMFISNNKSQSRTTQQSSTPTYLVQIPGMNLQAIYSGSESGYFGPPPQAQTQVSSFTLLGGEQFTQPLYCRNGGRATHTIDTITLGTASSAIISISPSLPITLAPGSSIQISLTIQVPNQDFAGTLNIMMTTH